MKLERSTSILLALGTATANWLIFYSVAMFFGSTQAVFIASILILSILIHELGHSVVLEANGIKTHMIFLIILGGVSTDKRYRAQEKNLHWNTLTLTYMAGVMGNLAFALFGFILYGLDIVNQHEFSQIINLNALLIFYNMFPVWITDGGRFAKIFFNSSPEHMDKTWVIRILIPILMAVLFLNIVTKEFFLFTLPVMFWSLHFQATHDDPKGSQNPKALSRRQRYLWAIIYLVIFITSMIMLSLSPDWLTGR